MLKHLFFKVFFWSFWTKLCHVYLVVALVLKWGQILTLPKRCFFLFVRLFDCVFASLHTLSKSRFAHSLPKLFEVAVLVHLLRTGSSLYNDHLAGALQFSTNGLWRRETPLEILFSRSTMSNHDERDFDWRNAVKTRLFWFSGLKLFCFCAPDKLLTYYCSCRV